MLIPVTYQDYLQALDKNPYYSGRWGYYEEAIKQGIERQPKSGLELGVWSFPLFKNSTVMGLETGARPGTVTHDAKLSPWPFSDKQFDLFMALQVWEHLEGCQQAAFKEVQRVARRAVISVPLLWRCADPTDMHHQLTLETFDQWWSPVTPTKLIVMPPWGTKRAIYVFDFGD